MLVAPQVGDTLDPDNQVAGDVFRRLSIGKAGQTEIMKCFSTFDTVLNAIESASVTKHCERLEIALLGIKANQPGRPLVTVLAENASRVLWLLLAAFGVDELLLPMRIDVER